MLQIACYSGLNLYYNNPKHHKLNINHYQTKYWFNIKSILQQSNEAVKQLRTSAPGPATHRERVFLGSSWCSSRFCTWTVIVHSIHVWHSSYCCNGWNIMHVLCWWYSTVLSFDYTQYAGGKINDERLHQPFCPPMANKSNRLRLNPDKTDRMWCATSRRATAFKSPSFQIEQFVIQPTSSARNLGVQLWSDLTIHDQVSAVVRSCNYNIRQ